MYNTKSPGTTSSTKSGFNNNDTTNTNSNNQSTTLPSISLPKGGGAIRGIGEKFGANPVTGTASIRIDCKLIPSNWTPQYSDNGIPGSFPSTRNMGLISHRWQGLTGGNPATVNKVVVTSYWQGETLQFDLWPPPRPSDTAKLHWMPEPGLK